MNRPVMKRFSIVTTCPQHVVSENLPEIATQLGVAHILEGSVQKSGDAVRVNVQPTKAANDSHLWADAVDRKLNDIFSVESEVAKAIAEQLRAKLTGQETQVINAKPTGTEARAAVGVVDCLFAANARRSVVTFFSALWDRMCIPGPRQSG